MESDPLKTACLKIKVIAGSDGDLIECVVDTIIGEKTDSKLYCLIHDWYAPDPAVTETLLEICCPTRRPGSALGRCFPILHLRLPIEVTRGFLFCGRPLVMEMMHEHIAFDFIIDTYKQILLFITRGKQAASAADIVGLISWYRKRVVGTLRKLVKVTPSINWMISSFGANEAEVVLTSSTYFFSKILCTKETLQHLVSLFTEGRGWQLTGISNYEEFCSMYSASQWLQEAREFFNYVEAKQARDDAEAGELDATIDAFRGQLLLSNQDVIRYIYLCFHQCLNKTAFGEYSRRTKRGSLTTTAAEVPLLCRGLDGDFREVMKTFFNKDKYISTHIRRKTLSLSGLSGYSFPGRSESREPAAPTAGRWLGQARNVSELVSAVNETTPGLCLGDDFSSLLELAAREDLPRVQELCFGGEAGRFPVFRTEFRGGHYFLVTPREAALEAYWKTSIRRPLLAEDGHGRAWSEEDLTRCTIYEDLNLQRETLEEQLLVSRHEYFNHRLPVFNLVLDFDLPLDATSARPSFEKIRDLCHELRSEILDALRIVGPLAPDHYVIFFKSACERGEGREDFGGDCEEFGDVEEIRYEFCKCTQKLGLRVIAPLPRGTALIGSDSVTSLVKIINRLVKMNSTIYRLFPRIRGDCGGPFDLGIYNSGRSIRLPHTYKCFNPYWMSRQLRLLAILPDGCEFGEYFRRATTLSYLLHHGEPEDFCPWRPLTAILEIADAGENYLAARAAEQLPAVRKNIERTVEVLTGLDLLAWLDRTAWSRLYAVILQYLPQDKVQQFIGVKFDRVSHNIIQLKPKRGSNFQCLRFNHRSRAQTVRIFLVAHASTSNSVTLTLMSQCFSAKCNSNRSTPHFSLTLDIKSEDN